MLLSKYYKLDDDLINKFRFVNFAPISHKYVSIE